MPRVIGLDHVVLRVADARRSLDWYVTRLGAEPLRVDEWERGEAPFVSVRLSPATIIDLLEADADGTNVDHVCLEIEPADLDALAASGDFDVVGGPAELWGARGMGQALYVHDPDGNVIELRWYP